LHRKGKKEKPSEYAKPTNEDALILHNGNLVEELFSTIPWTEIAFPLLLESIAGVSGRFTNGRFFKGEFTRTKDNHAWLSGYQCALEEFYNNLVAFVELRDKKSEDRREAELESRADFYNPFMEDVYGEEEQ